LTRVGRRQLVHQTGRWALLAAAVDRILRPARSSRKA
jgi:hypothetical protein